MDTQQLVDLMIAGGPPVIAGLLLVVWTGSRGVWVWGKDLVACEARADKALLAKDVTIEKLEKERDEWKQLALTSTGVLEHAARKVPG